MFKVASFVIFMAVALLAIAVGFVRSLPVPDDFNDWDDSDD